MEEKAERLRRVAQVNLEESELSIEEVESQMSKYLITK